jgi:hypothetical protein
MEYLFIALIGGIVFMLLCSDYKNTIQIRELNCKITDLMYRTGSQLDRINMLDRCIHSDAHNKHSNH